MVKMSTAEKFWSIVREEMNTRGIRSFRALEELGNVANGTVSQRARDLLPPTPTTISAIATAMDVPYAVVEEWKKGRRIPPDSRRAKEALHLFNQLTTQRQDDLLAQMRALVQVERQRTSRPESRREEAP